MTDATVRPTGEDLVRQARGLASRGAVRAAIDLLTEANRRERSTQVERELVRLRRKGGRELDLQPPAAPPAPLRATPGDGTLFEIEPADLSVPALRAGFAQSGCVLVRGLLSEERSAALASGIDAVFAAFDAADAGAEDVDPAWYDPGSMPDRVSPGLPAPFRRKLLRNDGGLWTVDSPRMLFELFELLEETGIGQTMTDFLGERPVLSAIKGTLRRVPPFDVIGGWHQDGAFLGEDIGAFNIWLSLAECGRDAPGLDIVPRRLDHVLAKDPEAQFDWSVSDDAVLEAADGLAIVRPVFGPGDALLFDHLLLHRTGASSTMTRDRHAIESWFFAPSAYPAGQLPILY
jgi:hypothetical protein